ncbi:MAG: hypothetical protein ACR2PC_04280 [Tsuneonella suprasediminis]|nr:hypothetical protein LBX01_03070 [Altererythrobacter sp. N1]
MAITAAICGYISVTSTLANALVKTDAAVAHSLSPFNGTITAELAAAEMTATPDSRGDSRPASLARDALRDEPTAVSALNVLGLQAQLSGDTQKARSIFAYSLALSRRNLQTHFWAIEDAVSRGDITGALQQYDIALRTSRRAPDVLFPVLAAAIAEPRVRAGLIDILHTHPVWGDQFIGFVSQGKIDPISAELFLRAATKSGLEVLDGNRVILVNELIQRRQADRAWRYYTSFRKGDRHQSRDPAFNAAIKRPSLFDWVSHNSTGISASVQSRKQGGVVEFSVAPSVGGKLIEQRQMLHPGVYQFESTIEDLQQPERSRPFWNLACQDGRDLGKINVPNAENGAVRFSGQFTVPEGCMMQTLALIARPSDEIAGVFGRVRYARLYKGGANE